MLYVILCDVLLLYCVVFNCIVLYCPVLHRRTLPLGISPFAVNNNKNNNKNNIRDESTQRSSKILILLQLHGILSF